ncbi:Serine/threonine protein kinase [Frankia canadensis]|uniref:non-specific serine/threonine protein kinase n=1 Tax=Frankia canadensis TaxID=1836972 RepID=A0A2I2L0J6_9ACTN|nr:protein kinase family protein [Frankia canadensis]SNQ51438.1 Serine/threonine protein kinase [Frankia canadensis]SOU58728.1 Serine/threonine protein kinase [Frankia canadensis]
MVDGSNRPQAEDVDNGVTLDVPGARGSATPAGTAVLAETVLDRRYRLLSTLTARGPVTLWRGDDNVLARPVAVRIVEHDQLAAGGPEPDGAGSDHEQAARRLLAAAINSGRLVHPGAASTYDATTTTTGSRRISYVVSEWVDGKTLRQLTAQGALRPEQAGAVVLAAARVIAAAHERGIHHGDLNPGDVIVSSHGTVKVIDLEIGGVLAELERAGSAAHEFDGGAGGDPEATRVTGAAGGAGDEAAADLRALGGLLYAGLTGHWPLGGDRGLPTAPRSGGRLRTPRQVSSSVPRDLDAITMAALGDDRAGAPITTAAELVEELESISPVDAVLDTGLMSLGDSSAGAEETSVDGFDSADYLGAPDYPQQGRYADTAGYPGPDSRYDDTRVDRSSGPRGGGPGYGRGGYDTRGSYDDGRGSYPPADRRPSGPGRGHASSGPSLSRMLPWIALVVVVVVVAVVALITLKGDGKKNGGGASPSSSATNQVNSMGATLTPASVTAFDPPATGGDGSENDDEAANATDGKPSTVWKTQTYASADLGRLKPGVGLLLDFGHPISPSSVTVQLPGSGKTSFELRGSTTRSDTIDGYRIVVQKSGVNGPVPVAMPSDLAPAQYWVLWLTSLPQDGGSFRGTVAEITFKS